MDRLRKTIVGIISLAALALIAGLAIGAWGGQVAPSWASPNSFSQPSSPPSQAGKPADDSSKSKDDRLMNMFMTNFTARLGVDEAKLNNVFVGAFDATASQAVKD